MGKSWLISPGEKWGILFSVFRCFGVADVLCIRCRLPEQWPHLALGSGPAASWLSTSCSCLDQVCNLCSPRGTAGGFGAKEDTWILCFLFVVGLWGLHLMVSPRGLPWWFLCLQRRCQVITEPISLWVLHPTSCVVAEVSAVGGGDGESSGLSELVMDV